MLKRSKGVVSVWVGDQISKADFERYVHGEDGDGEKRPINRFANDAKEKWFDHDYLEVFRVSGKNKPIRELFAGCSQFDGIVDQLIALAHSATVADGNCAILFFDHELSPPRWPKASPVKFLGNVEYGRPSKGPEQVKRKTGDHKEQVYQAVVSDDGRFGVTFGYDEAFQVWDLASGERIARKAGESEFVGWSADNSFITAELPDRLVLWSIEQSNVKKRTLKTSGFHRPQLTLDRKSVFWAHKKPVVGNLDHWCPSHVAPDTKNPAQSIIALPESRCATIDLKDELKIWDLATGKLVVRLKVPRFTTLVCANTDNEIVSTSGIYDASDGKRIRTLKDPLGSNGIVLLGKPAGRLACAAGSTVDTIIRTWDLSTGQVVQDIPVKEVNVQVAFAPVGRLAFTVSYDANLHAFNLDTGKKVATWRTAPKDRNVEHDVEDGDGRELTSIGVSSDGQRIVAGEASGRTFIFRFTDKEFRQIR